MSASFPEGTLFARRYRVVRLIAAGSMGTVYEVMHLGTERRRALKVMHAHLFQQADMRERFLREARIAANVQSDYIVDVFDAEVDEATGMPFLVMELLRGESLAERLERVGGLPPAEVMTYLTQIARVLDQTHAASIVHRDLKPENVFLTQRQDGTPCVKILDFGIAKLVAEGTGAAGATRTLGTPLYMAPEQFRARSRLTGAADIYALGMMAYSLLVGIPYWVAEASSAEDVIGFAMVAVGGPGEPPVQRAAAQGVALPPGFDAWFFRAAAVDPAARFRTATEAVQALGDALGLAASGALPAALAGASPGAGASVAATAPVPAVGPERERASVAPRPPFAGTSMGAAAMSVPARPRRGPLTAALVLLGFGALGVAGRVALHGLSDGAPAGVATPEVAAASPGAVGASAAPPPGAAVVSPVAAEPPGAPEAASAAPEEASAAPAAPASASAGAGASASAAPRSAASSQRPPPPPKSPRRLFGRD
ncbi:protein kinase domain-containing protein [Sorangium sp. So ce385]|uniref:serine/threonine-protein kinase n=1 Tax=Sorangium sp. So ce385 TaxID=3133308 RepID=UPI003F5C4CA9